RRYDVLVVDEAHNCAPAGRGKYAVDSQRTQALRLLAPHFEHKLFLTATPHNGYKESFSALLELLDSQRFARDTEPDRTQLETVMVRRLKSELPPKWDGSPRFPTPVLEPLEIAYPDEEREVHQALERYTKLREAGCRNQTERFATEFVLKTLKKRLFSSPAAFLTTLDQHESSLKNARKKKETSPTRSILERQVERVEEEFGDDERYESASTEAIDAASRLFREVSDEEAKLLRQMRAWAERATSQRDAKAKMLLAWLKETLKPGGKWNDERVIIFTEYRATQSWLQKMLAVEGFGGERLMLLYGGMDPEQRETVKAAFQYDPKTSPVRILLATDSASEGIDLQNHCSRLIHYEIPWNPNRMLQRNGRIDRHGQRAKTVQIFHFVGHGYRARRGATPIPAGDLEGDLEFLMRAAEKVQRIREDLGKVGPVIAWQVEEAMLGRRTTLDTTVAEREAEPARRMLKFERDVSRQIQKLREQLDDTRRELRLDPANVEKVVEVALELAGQPSLIPMKLAGGERAYRLPSLSGSWALSAEGLVHPHTGETRLLVFDPNTATGRDDLVLAHLNHRLVQMALRLLRAEVWATEGKRKLHRITARLAKDSELRDPVIVAYSRLVVIGGDRHRLHEEIIQAAGALRDGKFVALNVGETQKAIDAGLPRAVPASIRDRLVAQYGTNRSAVARALETRMRERTKGLEKLLAERLEKETGDIRTILAELSRTIAGEIAGFESPKLMQPSLFEGWTEPERQQHGRNIDALRQRLRDIPGETEREVAAIAARFADQQPRMFPIAVTLLLPERLARP
ncbi:MAG: DISARM system SNF2-like helicase DrmD, partial [Thermoanaerobaculia bacterium]